MYANAPGPKEFHMVKGASHFEMYDGEPYVLENIVSNAIFCLKERISCSRYIS